MSLPVFTNPVDEIQEAGFRNWGENAANVHTDRVYTALINAAKVMEERLATSLKNYEEHPDVVEKIIREGSAKARKEAQKILSQVRELVKMF